MVSRRTDLSDAIILHPLQHDFVFSINVGRRELMGPFCHCAGHIGKRSVAKQMRGVPIIGYLPDKPVLVVEGEYSNAWDASELIHEAASKRQQIGKHVQIPQLKAARARPALVWPVE